MNRFLLFSLSLMLLASCTHDPLELEIVDEVNDSLITIPKWRPNPTNKCDNDSVYFQNDVIKLIVNRCTPNDLFESPCHGGNFEKSNNVNLTDYNQIIKYVNFSKLDDPKESKLYNIILENEMPRVLPALTSLEKEKIEKWIIQGAKNNACNDCLESTSIIFETDVAPFLFETCSGCHHSDISDRTAFFKYPPHQTNFVKSIIDSSMGLILFRVRPTNRNAVMPLHSAPIYECEYDMLFNYFNQL